MEVEYLNSASVQWSGIIANPDKTMWASPSEIKELAVRSGDLMICEGGDVGRAAIYNGDPGRIFQNSVHRARPYQGSDVRYLKYLLTVLHGSGWLDIICNKATIAHLTVEKLGSLEIPQVSIDKQRRIADFLDTETARMDQLRATREQQLLLLDEREVSWRGQLFAKSWSGTRMRVKNLLRMKPRYGVLVPEFVDDGVSFIRVNNLTVLRNRDDLARIPYMLSEQYRRTITEVNDVLLCVVGSLGK
ncbi:MAG: restriction endonuclease subunit S, partial [Pseudonocardiaceae bacterium]